MPPRWMTDQANQAARDTIRACPNYRAADFDSALKIELKMSRLIYSLVAGQSADSLVSATLNA